MAPAKWAGMSRTFAKLLVAAALASLAFGCAADDPPDLGADQADLGVRRGIDYAWGRPSTGSLHAGGFQFAARYLSSDPSKNLSHAEASTLRGAGIDVATVWEDNADAALGGFGRGAADAHAAAAQADACGQPPGRPIYFAVDFDASSSDQGAIDSYFDGVASVLGRARTGAYADYYVLDKLFNAGKIRYGWQTESWSDGRWEGRAQLRQVAYDVSVGGVDSDVDDAVAADFGQWGYRAADPEPPVRAVVGANHDGRLELFFIDPHGAIQHLYEKEPGGATGWTDPAPLGGRAKSLALGTNPDGRLELFYVGTNDRIYHNWQNHPDGGWHGEAELGGKAKQLAVANHADGRIEVFYIGTDDALYHDWETKAGPWSGQHGLGGKAKQLAAATNADGRLEIFYVGTNDRIYHNWQTAPDGAWHGEAGFYGKAKQIAIAPNADGRLDVIYIGTDDVLYHDYETKAGPWSGQKLLDGKARSIAVASDADGAIELFYIGTDDALYHNYQHGPNGGWNGQAYLGGKAHAIAADRTADGRVELFYLGTNDELYHNTQHAPDSGWTGQRPL